MPYMHAKPLSKTCHETWHERTSCPIPLQTHTPPISKDLHVSNLGHKHIRELLEHAKQWVASKAPITQALLYVVLCKYELMSVYLLSPGGILTHVYVFLGQFSEQQMC